MRIHIRSVVLAAALAAVCGQAVSAQASGPAAAPAADAAAVRPADLAALYHDFDFDSLAVLVPDPGDPSLPVDVALFRLRAEARSGQPDSALPVLEAIRSRHPEDHAVEVTAAVVDQALGDLSAARQRLDLALAADDPEPEAWLVDASVRLSGGDAAGARVSLAEALRRGPELGASWLGYSVAERVGQANRDAGIIADAARRRADGAARKGNAHAQAVYEARARMFREAADRPLFGVETASDSVSVPLVPCYEGSSYSCIVLRIGGHDYSVLLDTGNAPGLTVHDPALRDAITTMRGSERSVKTGSVDTMLTSHDLLARDIDFGPFTITNAVGQFFPKPRDPYFDANINPFMLRGRVVTLDYGRGRLVIRTQARAAAAFAAAPPDRIARLPAGGFEWFYAPVVVNGRPATAMIETGGEELHLASQWAARNDVALGDTTITFRGRDYPLKMARVRAAFGRLVLPSRSALAGPAGARDPVTGMGYDLMVGPAALVDYAISFDPATRQLVLQPAP